MTDKIKVFGYIMRLEENRMITSNVQKIMEEKMISIRKMVQDTGISNMTILRARRSGINQCRLYTLEIMAEYFGCKTKDLYEED